LIRDIEAKTKVLEENITRQRKSMGGWETMEDSSGHVSLSLSLSM
jgi:hypothetical protein